ncbi:hypothetical protein E2320_011293, partial [Naja naja]
SIGWRENEESEQPRDIHPPSLSEHFLPWHQTDVPPACENCERWWRCKKPAQAGRKGGPSPPVLAGSSAPLLFQVLACQPARTWG